MSKTKRQMPGLRWRNGVWNIEKRSKFAPNGWIRESTGLTDRGEAEQFLIDRIAELKRQSQREIDGQHTFREAGKRYLREIIDRSSADDVAIHLSQLFGFIGDLELTEIHDGTLEPYIRNEQGRGLAPKSINNALGVVSAVLNRAASTWRDEQGRPWLRQAPPKISRVQDRGEARKPYPLNRTEQDKLIKALPRHLQDMVLFKVNTGCREQEVCQLRWEWYIEAERAFVIPAWVNGKQLVKNGEERLVVLNSVAQRVIDSRKGRHEEFVFTYTRGNKDPKESPVTKMNNTAWKTAWRAAGLPVDDKILRGVHNLKHTLGRRLRAAGCPLETRKVLLGHKDGDITSHYSAAELEELRSWLEKQADQKVSTPTLTTIRPVAVG